MKKLSQVYKQLIAIGDILELPAFLSYSYPFILLILFFFLVYRAFFKKQGKEKKAVTSAPSSSPYQSSLSKAKTLTSLTSVEGRILTRHFDRINAKFQANYFTELNSKEPHECQIIDLSLSGLGFVTCEKLKKGSRVRFSLPDLSDEGETFVVGGEVVRIRELNENEWEYGIMFFHVLKRNLESLQLLIDKHK